MSFLVLFLHKKRTVNNEKGLIVEVGINRKSENQLKLNLNIVPVK